MRHARARTRRLRLVVLFVLILIAAVAAWLFLVRREPPPSLVEQQAQEQLADVDRWSVVAEAEVALATIREDLVSERGQGGSSQRIASLAASLERALAAAAERVEWSDVDEALDRLEEQVRTDDPDAAETLALVGDALRSVGP